MAATSPDTLTNAKTVLLAIHFAAAGEIDSLTHLAAQNGVTLPLNIILRILLTYLPETTPSITYVPLLRQIAAGKYELRGDHVLDTTIVDSLNEAQAIKKLRRVRLLKLELPGDSSAASPQDYLSAFLIRRAYKVDENARLLSQLPSLVIPFLNDLPDVRTWTVSVLLPFVRRFTDYYPGNLTITLQDFVALNDRDAVDLLLAQTAAKPENYHKVCRDLRCMLGPWMQSEARWSVTQGDLEDSRPVCAGFERMLEWLTSQAASKSWVAALSGVEQWDGPSDVDLGGYDTSRLAENQQLYQRQRYARALMAIPYLIPEASLEAVKGAHRVLEKLIKLQQLDPITNLQMAASTLVPLPELCQSALLSPKNTTYMRNQTLDESNVLTTPSRQTVELLNAVIISAFLLTRAGIPCSVRMAGELALLENEHEQKEMFQQLIRELSERGMHADESFWIRARNEILWLKDWGAFESLGEAASKAKSGVFSLLSREFVEEAFLKALLFVSQYPLARAIYENGTSLPLSGQVVQEIVTSSALSAYDNASNPNRTRGGVRECDDILHAFPKTVNSSLPAARRIEALLKATHALADYRLVLRQGEPFTPVILRVHPDPISIIGRVLEQNPKSYTNIQALTEVAFNMVKAGLTMRDKHGLGAATTELEASQLSVAEKRVTAMCINTALVEHDFETAYSYVVSRLAQIAEAVPSAEQQANSGRAQGTLGPVIVDNWSWKAALNVGKYKRTSRTLRPMHLHGTTSGNVEIRHLEQRIECLSTALRTAPPPTLQEILSTFRRCEEELEAALKAEEAEDEAWDAAGDARQLHRTGTAATTNNEPSIMPGGFGPPPVGVIPQPQQPRKGPISAAKAAEDAPLSLFDLARAVAPSAQRNLQRLAQSTRVASSATGSAPPTRGSGTSNAGTSGGGIPSLGSSFGVVGGGLGGALGGLFSGPLGGSGGGSVGGRSDAGSGDETEAGQPRPRRRDQLRDAAMGTLVSGVGWLVGAPSPMTENVPEWSRSQDGRGNNS